MEKDYSYNRFGTKGNRVGQAVMDILAQDQPDYTAEEIMEGMAPKIAKELEETIEKGNQIFDHAYFVLLYFNKDLTQFNITNVMKMGFLIGDKKDDFNPVMLTCKHPNWEKVLYEVDPKIGKLEILWSIPDWQRCQLVAKSPHLYHPQMVEWILDCFEKKSSVA